ncbi:glycosyltransferase family 4 protein [Candidatus Uhrbacteria bacterium]|nr:glycosyltransferase family 4 protein [Candidatus Uhrbacteria bacterium]
MRLVIDARMMGAGNTRGIGRYIEEMLAQMRLMLPSGWEIVLQQDRIRWYSFAEQIIWPFILRKSKPDLLWVPHWNVPLLYRGKLAITIHDLLLLHQPTSAKASTRHPLIAHIKRLGHRIVLNNAVRRACVIFVPTHAVADDVASFYPDAKSKVIVTGEGLTQFPEPTAPPVSKMPAVNFILYVGSAYPHKRIDLLLEAWKDIAQNHPDLSLVITGEHDLFLKRHMDQVSTQSIPRVVFSGRMGNAELAWLFPRAKLFVFPSSFEGMGLPPIEALAAGCPVVCSDIPVLREVVPEMGTLFFRSGDKNDMIAAIERGLSDNDRLREEAARGGIEAAARHTWKSAAEKTLEGLKHSCRA